MLRPRRRKLPLRTRPREAADPKRELNKRGILSDIALTKRKKKITPKPKPNLNTRIQHYNTYTYVPSERINHITEILFYFFYFFFVDIKYAENRNNISRSSMT